MEFDEVLRRRRMIRIFSDAPVDKTVQAKILNAGNRGPSAGFSQGYAFLVLSEPAERAAFWLSLGQQPAGGDPVKRASLIIVPMANKEIYLDRYTAPDKGFVDRSESRWLVPYWHIDTGYAALLMMLAAINEGLGVQFFGILPPVVEAFRGEFGIPPDYVPIGALAIGHVDQEKYARLSKAGILRTKTRRRSLDEIVHRGTW